MTVERLIHVAGAEEVLSIAVPVLERDNLELSDGQMTAHPWTANAVRDFLLALVKHLRVENRCVVGVDMPVADLWRVWLAFDGARVLVVTAPVDEPVRVG